MPRMSAATCSVGASGMASLPHGRPDAQSGSDDAGTRVPQARRHRWVTDERWRPATELLPLLRRWRVRTGGRLAPVASWLSAMVCAPWAFTTNARASSGLSGVCMRRFI